MVAVQFALMDHVEGDADTPSSEVFAEVLSLVEAAEDLGLAAIWFAEHHFGVHRGHLPATPLLAVAAGQRTRRIHVGSAIICLNLHHPLAVAEQVATVDVLTGGRASFGFGSGCTPPEVVAFGLTLTDKVRRERFAEALDVMLGLWRGAPFAFDGHHFRLPAVTLRPAPLGDLRTQTWAAANSVESAVLAGERGVGLMTSRERPLHDLQEIVTAYRGAWERAGWTETPPVSAALGCTSAPMIVPLRPRSSRPSRRSGRRSLYGRSGVRHRHRPVQPRPRSASASSTAARRRSRRPSSPGSVPYL